ncbi:hypothetical protein ABZX75_17515 [Streptomyces sp. NPDC003038]|uniref:hypothetical protein n=1 Tax=unclassified Streptomyces TaxID=2593676 RepID=UPI0033BC38FF
MDITNITNAETGQAEEVIVLTRQDMETLSPWLHTTLTEQAKDDANSDPCQLLGALLIRSHRLYGTPAPTPSTCMCHGG